ncbi:uncharacterized protein LOC141536655 [Cotesia typhae]|uniref:uncharacterized protein LOC141536655 n=1 Tax=Cotesia typhae TaxID=2053667 RepID=UPI003D69E75A
MDASKIFSILLMLTTTTSAFIAYDCGAAATNFTTLSLINIKECEKPITTPNIIKTNIQLIQTVEYSHTKIIQCKIEIQRSIYYCGSWSHVATVTNPRIEYIEEISKPYCQDIHKTRTHFMYDTAIRDIQPNGTTIRSILFAGKADNSGNCEGGNYSDPYGTYLDVVVQEQIKITIRDYLAPVNFKENSVILKSGIRCWQGEGGYTFWDVIRKDDCETEKFKVIYLGQAQRIRDSSGNKTDEFFAVTSNQITFALTRQETLSVCGHKFLRTEEPRLFIIESNDNDFLLKKSELTTSDMDIFAYVNSKVVY